MLFIWSYFSINFTGLLKIFLTSRLIEALGIKKWFRCLIGFNYLTHEHELHEYFTLSFAVQMDQSIRHRACHEVIFLPKKISLENSVHFFDSFHWAIHCLKDIALKLFILIVIFDNLELNILCFLYECSENYGFFTINIILKNLKFRCQRSFLSDTSNCENN